MEPKETSKSTSVVSKQFWFVAIFIATNFLIGTEKSSAQPFTAKHINQKLNFCGENIEESDFQVITGAKNGVITTNPIFEDALNHYYTIIEFKAFDQKTIEIKLPLDTNRTSISSAAFGNNNEIYLLFFDQLIIYSPDTLQIHRLGNENLTNLYFHNNTLYLFAANAHFASPMKIGLKFQIFEFTNENKLNELLSTKSLSSLLAPILSKPPFYAEKELLYFLNEDGTSLFSFNLSTKELKSKAIVNEVVLKLHGEVLDIVSNGHGIATLQKLLNLGSLPIAPWGIGDNLYMLYRQKNSSKHIGVLLVDPFAKNTEMKELLSYKDAPLPPNKHHFPFYIADHFWLQNSTITSLGQFPLKRNCNGYKHALNRFIFPATYFKYSGISAQQITIVPN